MTDEHPPEPPPVTAAPARRRLRPFVAVAVLVAAVGVALATSSESPRAVVADAGSAGPTTTAASEPKPEPSTTTTAAPTTTTTTTTTTAPPPRVEPRATKEGTPAVPPRPGVRLTLRLDRTTVAAGEDFVAVLVIENGSSEDLVYSGDTCFAHHYGLYRDGDWVGGDHARYCQGISVPPVVVPPGTVKEAELRFDTRGRDYDRARSEYRPLSPGVHQSAGGIRIVDPHGKTVAWFTPAVDFEILAAP